MFDLIVFVFGVLTLMWWVFLVQVGAGTSFPFGSTTLWCFCLSCIWECGQMVFSTNDVFVLNFSQGYIERPGGIEEVLLVASDPRFSLKPENSKLV